MAVQAPVKPNFPDDDDETPLVFKRGSTSKQNQSNSEVKRSLSQRNDGQSSRQVSGMDDDDDDNMPLRFKRSGTSSLNQSNSEVKRSLSQKNDGQSSRLVSVVRPPNGVNSSVQKGKTITSTKASPVRSPLTSPSASTLSAKASPLRSTGASPNASTSSLRELPSMSPVANSKELGDQSKDALKHNAQDAKKDEDDVLKQPVKCEFDFGDSDDDMPLSARLKGNSNHVIKGPSVPHSASKLEDSDDEKPLSSRFAVKSTVGSSGGVSSEQAGKRPVALKPQQNGSIKRDSQGISSMVNKRPLDKANSSYQSSIKKPKLSESSVPLKVKAVSVKLESREEDDDDDHVPISMRIKKPGNSNKKSSSKGKVTKPLRSSLKKTSKKSKKGADDSGYSGSSTLPPSWSDGQKKWTTLVHSGVIFPPPYEPHGVKMLYKGKSVDLTPEQEEVATMFAVMKDTDYVEKPKFRENFWNDWRKILGKNHVIQSLEDCDFTPIYEWAQQEKEKKKQMSKEEKQALKETKMKEEEKYMWAIVDGVKEKVGNFRVEPPALFRGRGEHPKMGKLKRRIYPSDITINIGKDAPIPECPVPGERWKEVRHDNTVTWLAYWQNPIYPKVFKYVFLAPSSSLKGQSDKEKYEKARMLKQYIKDIRANYTRDFTSKDIAKRQIAVATYLIDKLALRAGNEKDDDEADTVGCCTLKVENVTPIPPSTLKFDFLGKDSIRYQNEVEVELPVYKSIERFREGKKNADDLFDKLDTSKLNAHLKELMPGLTAKVFRTYNASITLDEMLHRETRGGAVDEKVVVYNQANKEVAIICNHQRTISKSHAAQMAKLDDKIEELKGVLNELKVDLARAKKGKPPLRDAEGKRKRNLSPEALEKKIDQTTKKIEKFERNKLTKEDLKTVALNTSKINYCDPRITVAWCKRHEVPIEKIFQKTLLAKFAWAMDTDPGFRF